MSEITWDTPELIKGECPVANISIQLYASGPAQFTVEWTVYGEGGYGTVSGSATGLTEAKEMCEALCAIRAKRGLK
jgi:hypothetical protein